jgi:hypothetical protein
VITMIEARSSWRATNTRTRDSDSCEHPSETPSRCRECCTTRQSGISTSGRSPMRHGTPCGWSWRTSSPTDGGTISCCCTSPATASRTRAVTSTSRQLTRSSGGSLQPASHRPSSMSRWTEAAPGASSSCSTAATAVPSPGGWWYELAETLMSPSDSRAAAVRSSPPRAPWSTRSRVKS